MRVAIVIGAFVVGMGVGLFQTLRRGRITPRTDNQQSFGVGQPKTGLTAAEEREVDALEFNKLMRLLCPESFEESWPWDDLGHSFPQQVSCEQCPFGQALRERTLYQAVWDSCWEDDPWLQRMREVEEG